MPHSGEYVDCSNKKRVHFEDLNSDYGRPSVKRKVSETVSISTMLDKTSRSHAQVGIFYSYNGHKKDTGSGSKDGSARRRKNEGGKSLSRVDYDGREGHSRAGEEE